MGKVFRFDKLMCSSFNFEQLDVMELNECGKDYTR